MGGSGWTTIPVAFSNGNGTFTIANRAVSSFPGWAQAAGAQVAVGDFNGDGRDDLLLAGVPGWTTVPVAFSNGDGTFTVSNNTVNNIPGWSTTAGVKVLAGDVDGDGRDDVILVGGSGWWTIPIGFSTTPVGVTTGPNAGTFASTNQTVADFPAYAAQANVQASVTDVNGDGKADIVLVGGTSWTTIPVAYSTGSLGNFSRTLGADANIPGWAQATGAKLATGCRRSVASPTQVHAPHCDVNADHHGDVMLTGGATWFTVPVGLTNTANPGTFTDVNNSVTNFPYWAQDSAAKMVSGDFDGDGKADMALLGGNQWWTTPIAFSTSAGSFTVTNSPIY